MNISQYPRGNLTYVTLDRNRLNSTSAPVAMVAVSCVGLLFIQNSSIALTARSLAAVVRLLSPLDPGRRSDQGLRTSLT
jgi:hypothetical protein